VPILRAFLPLMIGASLSAAPAAPAAPTGSWGWPVLGPVVRGFDPPETPFGAGHRGIDIATPIGTTVLAPESGVVTFAGRVGGELFVTLDHGGGLTSTYSWLSAALVRVGDAVGRGAPIAQSGRGHPGSVVSHLHFGIRQDGVYLDPLSFLGPLSVSSFIRLAPLSASTGVAPGVDMGLAA
jgi:murein DD-endopeptidase MepM/ murein hydrolase activator NlpD